jgi:AbrB family looped-hinge helix DNA binding protein
MGSIYVTTKNRIVIPARLHRKLCIQPGTKVCFIERGGDILFQPITKQNVRSLCGILKDTTSATAELLIERNKDREQEQAKRKRSVHLSLGREWPGWPSPRALRSYILSSFSLRAD